MYKLVKGQKIKQGKNKQQGEPDRAGNEAGEEYYEVEYDMTHPVGWKQAVVIKEESKC